MSWMGRYQLGQSVPLYLRTVNAADTPVEPTDVPQVKLWKGSTKVAETRMPVIERTAQTGTFFLSLYLGPAYSAGNWVAEFRWVLADGYIGSRSSAFAIVAGGDADGAVVSMYFYSRPHADFVVHQKERGTVLPGKNPFI